MNLSLKEEIQIGKGYYCLYDFVKVAWHIVEPSRPFVPNWHIEALCDHLEAVTYGWIRKLLINIPPGHAKSLIVSVLWPAWVWLQRAEWRALFGSYDLALARRDSLKCRDLIVSPWYRENYIAQLPIEKQWELSEDQNEKKLFKNTRSGFRLAISVGSGTGQRGNAVIVDDPLSADQARSKADRDRANYWFSNTMPTRVDDQRRDVFVVIMQRLHEEDTSGVILSEGGWEHVCLPSEFDSKRRSRTFIRVPLLSNEEVTTKMVSGELTGDIPTAPPEDFWEDPRTKDGELLFPQMFPQSVLDELKKPTKLGSIGFASQHGQLPMPANGEIFQTQWWRFWKPDGVSVEVAEGYKAIRPDGCWGGPAVPLPAKFDRIAISLDCTFKKTTDSDYVCFGVIGTLGADRYILKVINKKMTFTETCNTFESLCNEWPLARAKYIEDKANGSAVIDTFQRKISGIIAVNPEGGKESRANSVQPQVESGNVFLADGAVWLDPFLAQFRMFPKGKHDDMVDMLSQGLLKLSPTSAVQRARNMTKGL